MPNETKGRKYNQKMKPYLIYQYLLRFTDENHKIPAEDIVTYLTEDLHIDAERRSIYRDIDSINKALWLLENEGCTIEEAEEAIENDEYDSEKAIILDKHACNGERGFYASRRKYEVTDIRLISECIYSSRYISQEEAERLVSIMKEFVSDYQAESIKTDALVTNRIRTINKNSLNNIAVINDAMSRKIDGEKHVPEKISFKYLKYSIDNINKLVERRKGESYVVSPYKLIINDGNYYLLAFDDRTKKLLTYRVDRMKSITRIGEPRDGEEEFKSFDLTAYSQKTFSMFSGEKKRVKLRFVNSLLDTAIERFGHTRVIYDRFDETHFSVSTDVEVSDQFYGWLLGLGNKVKILEPTDVVDDFRKYIGKISGMYD